MAGAPIGNKNASRQRRMVTDALTRAAAQNPEMLAEACMKVLEKARDGDLASFTVLADRLDGKPPQSIEGEVGGFTVILNGADTKTL